ncbi:Endonuclease domain-containing 1 protein [Channa argus]|uniref:Endonuclease domain-containing 1 protein n=1 Tax=Channa argus TaxID=215402 RepID=A0A6G1Q637_CHAAH|nr:Endonuclease domain-containing 1 protein [Channa argus]KAK2899624.1 hypothetical protein Q8A73_012753 [Channa argus]
MMTSLKMWSLLSLSVLFLLSIVPTETKVVQSMSQCDGFLFKKPPQVPEILEQGRIRKTKQYKIICQTYNNKRRFVTLYDTKNKIPVFSAYKYRGDSKSTKVQKDSRIWMMEPQLEDLKNDENMEECDRSEYNHQASDDDYKTDPHYDRGHLLPKSYAYDESDKISTCTLTNIVPQVKSFNNGSWKKMEECVKGIFESHCLNKEAYVLIGAKPSENNMLNNKVNIPSMLWSAFCCNTGRGWVAGAFWGDNVEANSKYLGMKTLTQLHHKLSKGHSSFEAFPGTKCPLNQMVSNHFPEINQRCQKGQRSPSASTTLTKEGNTS